MNGLIYAIDFDGTCVTHEYPEIGKDVGAVPVLKRIVAAGGFLVLNTMRSGEGLDEAVEWFTSNEIPLYGVQKTPTQEEWTTSPKVYAQVYIDDAALGCPLSQGNFGERAFVNWKEVEKILFPEEDEQNSGG